MSGYAAAVHLAPDRGGRSGWWRSQTFADDTREIVLLARLAPAVAGGLHERMRELWELGVDRVVLDVTASRPLGREEIALLAGVLERQPAGTLVVLVAPEGMQVTETLGRRVILARSLTQARRIIGSIASQQGPAAPLSPEDRHALAVRQSLRWADLAAAGGDYDRALSWLATVEAVEGSIPEPWRGRRRAWVAARQEAARTPRARPRRNADGAR